MNSWCFITECSSEFSLAVYPKCWALASHMWCSVLVENDWRWSVLLILWSSNHQIRLHKNSIILTSHISSQILQGMFIFQRTLTNYAVISRLPSWHIALGIHQFLHHVQIVSVLQQNRNNGIISTSELANKQVIITSGVRWLKFRFGRGFFKIEPNQSFFVKPYFTVNRGVS
jgi:hypothetical protein